MKSLLNIFLVSMLFVACDRRDLTYLDSASSQVVLNVDWQNLSQAPSGMTVYCFPKSGGDPIVVVEGDNVYKRELSLPADTYTLLLFNRQISDFDYVEFRGMDSFDTAEVFATASSQESLAYDMVYESEEIAAATYLDLVIEDGCDSPCSQLCSGGATDVEIKSIDLVPVVVVKLTKVRIVVNGIYNLRTTNAAITGMSEGYNFSTQMSCSLSKTHTLAQDKWEIEPYEAGDTYGATYAYYVSFGVPNYTTETRTDGDWDGTMDLKMNLVDNQTTHEVSGISLKDKLTRGVETGRLTTTITLEVGSTDETDESTVKLPDVVPAGDDESGFDAGIDDWGDEIVIPLP